MTDKEAIAAEQESLADRLERHPNPGGRLDVLAHGILKAVVGSQEAVHNLPPGVITGILREPIAKLAVDFQRGVDRLGLSPKLAGLGLLLIGVNAAKKAAEKRAAMGMSEGGVPPSDPRFRK